MMKMDTDSQGLSLFEHTAPGHHEPFTIQEFVLALQDVRDVTLSGFFAPRNPDVVVGCTLEASTLTFVGAMYEGRHFTVLFEHRVTVGELTAMQRPVTFLRERLRSLTEKALSSLARVTP